MKKTLFAISIVAILGGIFIGCGSETEILIKDTGKENREGDFFTPIKEIDKGMSLVAIKNGVVYVASGDISEFRAEEKTKYKDVAILTPEGKLIESRDINYVGSDIAYGKGKTSYGIYDVLNGKYDVKLEKEEIEGITGLKPYTMDVYNTFKDDSYVYEFKMKEGTIYVVVEDGGRQKYISEPIKLDSNDGKISIVFNEKSGEYIGISERGRVYEISLANGKIALKEISKIEIDKDCFVKKAYVLKGEIYIQLNLNSLTEFCSKLLHYNGESGQVNEVYRGEINNGFMSIKRIVGIDSSGYALFEESFDNNKLDKYETYLGKITPNGVERIKTLAKDTDEERFSIYDFIVNEEEGKIAYIGCYNNIRENVRPNDYYNCGLMDINK